MDDLECPRCRTTKYRSPNLKLMVNVCGHALCENCVELLFMKGSGTCPQCNIALRRSNFRIQIFEDASVEKELDIRRKVLSDYNKKEEDFDTLREYNDYLDEIETIIYNLANNVDVENTKRKVEQYKRENQSFIKKYKGKKSKDLQELEDFVEHEKYEKEARHLQIVEEELEGEKFRQKKKEALIDDLMFSDLSAKDIISSHSANKNGQSNMEPPPKPSIHRKKTTFSMSSKLQNQVFLPVPKQNTQNLFVYAPLKLDNIGPPPFTPNTFESHGFLLHVRNPDEVERSSGYLSDYACQRALDDAFNGLFLFSGE